MSSRWCLVVTVSNVNNIPFGNSSPRKARRSLLAATLAVCGLFCYASSTWAGGTPDLVAGAKTFKANCVLCHGEDGHVSATGKALKAADLNSDAVQKLSVQEMIKIVTNGKGNMPTWKATLTPDQIASVVAYVRHQFGKKK